MEPYKEAKVMQCVRGVAASGKLLTSNLQITKYTILYSKITKIINCYKY